MPPAAPPNDALAALADVLGVDNVRTLVRTFLREFPDSMKKLEGGDRTLRHRLVHSMKSSTRLVGALDLSQRMATLEARLMTPDGDDLTAEDLAGINQDFAQIAAPLRDFAAG
jgi:HPt (histidine-containing phosphotransfer) domain-containing protein